VRIAIVGAGVSGCYVGNILKTLGHEVIIFEASTVEAHWPVCAWGASKNMLKIFSSKAGLNFDEYILHEGRRLRMELPNGKREFLDLIGLVTYDKRKWERDLTYGLRINYNTRILSNSQCLKDFDFVLDCTGLHRSLLPKSNQDFIIPAYEFLVDNVDGLDEFYVIGYKGARGYFWYFPLDERRAYVGAGDIDRKYLGIDEFFRKHPSAKIIKKIGRPIRLAPPKRMLPFYKDNVIGVGESIGTVFPMLGEGIIPSLICCDIFIELFKSRNFNPISYTKKVLKKFEYYDDVYRIIRLKMEGNLSTVRHFPLLMRMYRNMKKEEQRFGFEINFEKMNRLIKAL
jgi:flavin-dependent dehydrogenase